MPSDSQKAAQILRGHEERIRQLEEADQPDLPANLVEAVENGSRLWDDVVTDVVTGTASKWDTATWAATNYALDFDGSGDFMDLNSQFTITAPATLTWWAKLTQISSPDHWAYPGVANSLPTGFTTFDSLISFAKTDHAQSAITSGTVSDVQFRLEDDDGDPWESGSFSYDLDTNPWIHCALVFNADTSITGYVDGVDVGETVPITFNGLSLQRIAEGYGGGTNDGKGGKFFDDFRRYSRALSASEVSNLASGTDVTNGLVSRWRFDEGSGSTAKDSIGSNNGTITGATYTSSHPSELDTSNPMIWT